MEKKTNRRKPNRRKNQGIFSKMFVNVGGDPEAIEGEDWYLDAPDVRLTKIFSVVLILHIIAIGGILIFKVVNRHNNGGGEVIAKSESRPSETSGVVRDLAGEVDRGWEIEVSRRDRYQVIAGDTLNGIAIKLGVSSESLKIANNITEPDKISEGMWLEVPVAEFIGPNKVMEYDKLPEHPAPEAPAKGDQMKSVEIPESDDVDLYEVQSGDTLWGISQKFEVDHKELLRMNGIERPELLQVGQTIYIPSK